MEGHLVSHGGQMHARLNGEQIEEADCFEPLEKMDCFKYLGSQVSAD